MKLSRVGRHREVILLLLPSAKYFTMDKEGLIAKTFGGGWWHRNMNVGRKE